MVEAALPNGELTAMATAAAVAAAAGKYGELVESTYELLNEQEGGLDERGHEEGRRKRLVNFALFRPKIKTISHQSVSTSPDCHFFAKIA